MVKVLFKLIWQCLIMIRRDGVNKKVVQLNPIAMVKNKIPF